MNWFCRYDGDSDSDNDCDCDGDGDCLLRWMKMVMSFDIKNLKNEKRGE